MKRSKKQKSKQSGFSIIELIIVFLIIAIVAVASIPMTRKNLQLYRMEMAAGMISSSLMEARLAAIKRNQTAWLEVNPADNSLKVRSTNPGGNPITLGTPLYLPEGTVIDSNTTVSTNFTSLGRIRSGSSTTTRLTFSNITQCKDIKVSNSGKISIKDCPVAGYVD
jgi:prepilin-type N-terminal cleavage/methylation domain-containing protein